MLSKELYQIANQKSFFKSLSKIVKHFHFKDALPKKLCSGIIYYLSVIAASLFIMAKQMPLNLSPIELFEHSGCSF